MSKSINVTTIEKACKIFDSQRKPIRKADRKPGQFPYYGASGIADYIDDYVFDGTYLLLSEDGDNLRTQNTPIAFLAEGKFWVNNHAHVLQGKDGNLTNYICYALQIADIKSYISGSTRPKITQADMRRIQLNLPPLPEQKAIAHILGKLDDKIELNRQMNQTLEAMAQALFKSWFVDFDPVLDNAMEAGNPIPEALHAKAEKHKAVPDNKKLLFKNPELAAQFPSAFVFNETLNKWIPEGWEVKSFGEEFNITMGQSPPGSTYNEDGIGKPFFQGKTDFGFRFPTNRIYCTEPKREAKKNDTLISVRAPVGNANLANSECVIGRGLCAVRHKSKSVSFTYYSVLDLKNVFDVFEGEGTVFGSINQTSLKSIQILKPEKNVVQTFDELVSKWDAKIEINTIETETLTQLRDTLLPQLISGKVRVNPEHFE